VPDSESDHQPQWGDEEGEAPTPKAAPVFHEGDARDLSTKGRLWKPFLIIALVATGLTLMIGGLLYGLLYYLLPGR